MKKVFAIWSAIAALAWAAAFGAEHWNLTAHPRHVAVVLDSTYPMTQTWDRARTAAEDLDGGRYALYAAYTDKARIHGWSRALNFGRMLPYGPHDDDNLARIAAMKDVGSADRVLFVTSDPAQRIPSGWEIVEVSPAQN